MPHLLAEHFVASGRIISASTVRRRLHNSGIYARRPVVCVPLHRRYPGLHLSCTREHVSWTRQQMASLLFTQISPDSHCRVIQDICSSGGNEA
ncbi:HTH_Tnp_Tc3_2 domain-containing protein [Trichonephila clavipes]|nr:HTH_Tnp_Tc3_2 domain-containing protein [Trichonephila clavipes]